MNVRSCMPIYRTLGVNQRAQNHAHHVLSHSGGARSQIEDSRGSLRMNGGSKRIAGVGSGGDHTRSMAVSNHNHINNGV